MANSEYRDTEPLLKELVNCSFDTCMVPCDEDCNYGSMAEEEAAFSSFEKNSEGCSV